jgi:organic hydroperoxide reductase OsmC/OhrA
MIISEAIKNSFQKNDITVTTDTNKKKIGIPAKANGYGSSTNEGELLLLSLAACFCNDVYREGTRKKMHIHSGEVCVLGRIC